jgi:alpha-1,3-glucosyltransferase
VVYTFVWFIIFLVTFNNLVIVRNIKRRVFLLDRLTLIYMMGFIPVTLFSRVVDYMVPRFEFLKLMSISVYCAVGIVGSWAGFSWLYFFDDDLWT